MENKARATAVKRTASQDAARRAQIKADSALVAAHLSKKGLFAERSGGAPSARQEERFERKVRSAAGKEGRTVRRFVE